MIAHNNAICFFIIANLKVDKSRTLPENKKKGADYIPIRLRGTGIPNTANKLSPRRGVSVDLLFGCV
jgi:hypothetical protein